MAGERTAGSVQMAVGFGGGEALVPEVNGKGEGLAEGLRKCLRFGGHGADVAGHIKRVAEDDGGAVKFAKETTEGPEILLCVAADEGENGLGCEPQLVGDGDADTAVSKIEAKKAGLHTSSYPHTRRKTASYNQLENPTFQVSDLVRRFFLLVLLALLGLAGFVGFALMVPAGPRTETFVDVNPGMSSSQIAGQLKQQGIIRSRDVFLGLYLARGGTLKAGEYRFDHPARMTEVFDRLRRGDVYTIAITIPEGSNVFDIGARLEAAGLGTKDNFVKAALADKSLIAELDPSAPSLEGYLFPDTYRFTRRADAQEMLAAMVKRFRQATQQLGLTSGYHETVTMASLVEKETPIDQERPLVASVFGNRMEKSMPLMTDPSVIYAALLDGRYRGTIYQSDLDADSPYNTYRHAGLPPGPICNPGMKSLAAAMHPAQTDYLYFVAASADPSGKSRFSATLEEHAKDVDAYRRAVRQSANPQ